MTDSSPGVVIPSEGPTGFTAINPDAFRHGFSVNTLLSYLARDEVKQKLSSRVQLEGGTAPLVAKASLERVQRLVDTLGRAEQELQTLQGQITRKVNHLTKSITKQQSKYQASIEQVENIGDQARSAYKAVEAAANRVSQVGLRIGDRLQTADAVRSRALELVSLLSYLHAFSQLDAPTPEHSAEEQFKKLPPVFWEEKSLADAAVGGIACKLTALTAEAHNAKQRSRLVNAEEQDTSNYGVKGSLNYTTWQLAGYCNWLEVRVVTRFDRGYQRGSTRVMAECAAIMAKFQAEKLLIQRFLDFLPVFQEDDESGGVPRVSPPTGTTAQQISSAMQPFNSLCDLLQATLEAEVHRLVEIFSNGTQAVEMFIMRLCTEHMVPALQTLLLPPEMDSQAAKELEVALQPALRSGGLAASGPQGQRDRLPRDESDEDDDEEEGSDEETDEDEEDDDEEEDSETSDIEDAFADALTRASGEDLARRRRAAWGGRKAPHMAESPELLAMRLKILKQVHAHVMDMAAAFDTAVLLAGVRSLNLSPLRDGLFLPYLANYPYPELRWLDICFKVALSKQPHPQVDPAVGHLFINNNKESLSRAAALSKGNEELCAAHVKKLFHGAGPFGEVPGSLLEQLALYIIDGVEHTLKLADIQDCASQAKAEVAAFHEARAAAQAQALQAAQAAAEAATRKRRPNDPPLPQPPQPPPPVTKHVAAERATQFATTRLQAPLQAVNAAVSIMNQLQGHYASHVEPRVAPVLSELAQCSQGLLLLVKAVEESVSMVLQKVVDAVIIQAEVSLITHQTSADFFPLPPGGSSQAPAAAGLPRPPAYAAAPGVNLSQPTAACMVVCAQLAAMHRLVINSLEGTNLVTFLQEVGLRVQALLVNHMQQYRYNAAGALRWKCDITEYVELIRSWEVAGLREKLQEVQALANILVVPPDSLLGLVDAGLRLDHQAALKFLALREDFPTARVDGKTLQELFSAGHSLDSIISHPSGGRD